VSLLFASAAWAGDFEDGSTAFENKNYAQAIQKYKEAGTNGDAFAQLMVGAMYDDGGGGCADLP
jgi:TPR repeat protein